MVSKRVCGCVGFAVRANLSVDVRDMARDSAQAEHQLAGYFGICATGRDQAQDLDFAPGEATWIGRLPSRGGVC
jgi:hypothetical protein